MKADLSAVSSTLWSRTVSVVWQLRTLARENPTLLAGVTIIALWLLATVFAPLITPHGPEQVYPNMHLMPPNQQFLFGTDQNGRDVLARTLYAFRYDMLIAISAIGLAMLGGVAVGAIVAAVGGVIDTALMRVMDVLFAFPSFILALMLAGALGPSTWNLVVSIAVVFLPLYARLVRGSMLAEKEKQYVEAAYGIGVSRSRLVLKHMLPNSLGPVITQSAMNVSWAIMTVAGISYLGFGVQPPTPEWGLMVNEGAANIVTGEWWVSFFPGIAILSLVAGLILLDDGLRAEL